ncbi:inactive peptidyl-prolyl cis-trans isomerase FKBP6-like [Rhopalosiphum padi]|uniref:inactive peptidyl-prolyl cis-trans isomerase FKBP6-like n=1 Tax=Rhopalosiphum padi TaxID=40932 RepID=UPI00298E75FA|nr:inactive peptidyl-prolyl cis-trans isomerase FKBP6-like [Rhopalosiphum padi]XP_060850167.1 inactive peptidyl-prolyl cis-trans isomerase FKBP6-like [Rhopalosiphum padi]XP_060850168.1 inactive peptidyl-prolyl cis-trans isomerase FKBP6-like [Rhopalosiphum padi]XP_060850169.1 inactive peptidyl-prolyl cis-trans isomerase FKBP6-like [Rhopalosiphum padi]XP_060850170.1 inactive peptidyl-prolyl cis-trans isomerase FKBP6-like [Rhopalosiphum padi]XP_060850171.1 inactive peptidyl-prolyl cis-trans isome
MADDDSTGLPPNVLNILKTASEEILNKQDGYCFTVDNSPTEDANDTFSYDAAEMAEFTNFDMIGEEDDNLESFNHLITNKNHEDLTGDRKVLKILLEQGIGQVVPENYVVFIHYIAYISNLQEPFDVTYIQGRRPKRFTLGNGELLPGLEIGIKTMTTGENARFIIKPELAYREFGCPPRIPPNATILFDVHLVSFLSPESILTFDRENRDPNLFNKNLVQVKKLHLEANEQFKLKNIEKAIFNYNRALELLHLAGCKNDNEEIEMMKYLNKLYTNLSLCYLKQCAFNKVCRMGIEAMKYSERFSKRSAKLFFNWGKALRFLKDFTEAKKKTQIALKLEPQNETIHNEIHKLEKDKEFHHNIELITFKDDNNADDNERVAPEFWEVFNTSLIEFYNGNDDVLTVMLNKNPDDIEVIKNKASAYDLQVHIITKAGVQTNCIAIQK